MTENLAERAEALGLQIEFEERSDTLTLVMHAPEGSPFSIMPRDLAERAIHAEAGREFLEGFFCARLSKSTTFSVTWNAVAPDLISTLEEIKADYVIDESPQGRSVRLRAKDVPEFRAYLEFLKAEESFMRAQTGIEPESKPPEPDDPPSAESRDAGGTNGAPYDTTMVCPPFGTLGQIARALRRDSRHSVVATGRLPRLNEAIYVRDNVDEQIASWMTNAAGGLLVLTGSAGHGKSAAISLARQTAEASQIHLHVRPDASHSDHPTETYREGLRRFLDDWRAHPGEHHILAINLGKALDFFANPDDLQAYPEVAWELDQKYSLGLIVDNPGVPGIEIIDLSQRVQPIVNEQGLDIPLVRQILEKFDPGADESIIDLAWNYQIQHGLGDRDPILANIRLLRSEHFRKNLLEALASSIVRHDLHLTPRSVLDLISRLIVPEAVERMLDAMGMWSSEQRKALAEPKNWGTRLHASLLAELFPSSPKDPFADQALQRLMRFEDPVVRALRHENPAYVRSREMDDRLIAWSHDPDALAMDIPDWFLAYLEWVPSAGRWAEGPRALMQVARWTDADAPRSHRVEEVVRFLQLVNGTSPRKEDERLMLKRALQQCVTKTYFQAMSDRNLGQLMAIKVHRTPTKVSVRTSLSEFDIRLSLGNFQQRAFNIEILRDGQGPVPLVVDWPTFDLLSQVHRGVNPGALSRATNHVIDKLVRTLQAASSMTRHLECEMPDKVGILTLDRDQTSKETRIRAQVRHD